MFHAGTPKLQSGPSPAVSHELGAVDPLEVLRVQPFLLGSAHGAGSRRGEVSGIPNLVMGGSAALFYQGRGSILS